LEVLHRDEFLRRYPNVTVPTPYVLTRQHGGDSTVTQAGALIAGAPELIPWWSVSI